jgi:predicted nucleic acid-binding protein
LNRYLLDTSVLSVFAPDRPKPSPEFRLWVDSESAEDWYLSSIVIVEIERGIARLRRSGGASRADRLGRWLTDTLSGFAGRVLPVDEEVARNAGEMEDAAIASGRNPGLADILIDATARTHDLTVLTSNARHFEMLGVRHFDPLTAPMPR